MTKSKFETFCPRSQAEWREWLKDNHHSKQSVWLIFYKTSSKNPSISWSDAVDEALCFGWIDSTKKSMDEERYMQYFSKRKPTSIWSKINKEKVALLIETNKMTEAGLESIETARQNGSWTKLNDIEALVIPEDLKAVLRSYDHALEYFENLSRSNQKILLYWIASAKRPETRQKRIIEISKSASLRKRPSQFT